MIKELTLLGIFLLPVAFMLAVFTDYYNAYRKEIKNKEL